jgi:transposase
MRPYGTTQQLQNRREQALKLLNEGRTAKEVAARMKVTVRSVYRWRQEKKQPKPKSKRPPGRSAYLTKDQIKNLAQELLKGAYAHGYSEDYWTLDRVGRLIWELYKVRYTPSGVWRLLDGMGWSCQKVQRLAIQRDDEAIRNWNIGSGPRSKKVARPEGNAPVHR